MTSSGMNVVRGMFAAARSVGPRVARYIYMYTRRRRNERVRMTEPRTIESVERELAHLRALASEEAQQKAEAAALAHRHSVKKNDKRVSKREQRAVDGDNVDVPRHVWCLAGGTFKTTPADAGDACALAGVNQKGITVRHMHAEECAHDAPCGRAHLIECADPTVPLPAAVFDDTGVELVFTFPLPGEPVSIDIPSDCGPAGTTAGAGTTAPAWPPRWQTEPGLADRIARAVLGDGRDASDYRACVMKGDGGDGGDGVLVITSSALACLGNDRPTKKGTPTSYAEYLPYCSGEIARVRMLVEFLAGHIFAQTDCAPGSYTVRRINPAHEATAIYKPFVDNAAWSGATCTAVGTLCQPLGDDTPATVIVGGVQLSGRVDAQIVAVGNDPARFCVKNERACAGISAAFVRRCAYRPRGEYLAKAKHRPAAVRARSPEDEIACPNCTALYTTTMLARTGLVRVDGIKAV
jgi:hypothetical protein